MCVRQLKRSNNSNKTQHVLRLNLGYRPLPTYIMVIVLCLVLESMLMTSRLLQMRPHGYFWHISDDVHNVPFPC